MGNGLRGALSVHRRAARVETCRHQIANLAAVTHEFDIFQSALPIVGLPVGKSTNVVDEWFDEPHAD